MQASSGSGSVRRALAYLKKSRVLGVVDYFYRVEFHSTPRFFSDSNYLFFFSSSHDAVNDFSCGFFYTSDYTVWLSNHKSQKLQITTNHFILFIIISSHRGFPQKKFFFQKKREGLVTESAVAFQQLNFTRTKLRPPSGSLRGFKRRQQGQDTSSSASVSTANSSLGAVSTSSISTSSSLQSFHQAVHPAPNAVVHILQQPRTPIQHQLPYYELHQPAPTGFYSPQPHYPYVRAVVAATPPLSRPVAAPPTHHRRAESAGAQRQKPHAIPRLPPPLVKAPPSTDRFLAEEADARMQIAIMHESNVANFEAMHAKIWFQQKLESNRREMSAEGDSGAVKSAENHGSRRDWTGAETLPDEPKEFPPPSVETKDLRRVTMSDDVDFPAKEQRRVTIAPGSVDFDTRVLAAAPHSSVASVPLAPSSVPTKSHTEAEETEGGKEHAMRMLLQAATPFLLWPVLKYLPDLTDPDNKTASKKVNTNGGRRTTSL